VNGTAAVARYTLLELSRRRILLVFFIIGAAGIALLGILLKVFSSAIASTYTGGSSSGPNGGGPQFSSAQLSQLVELTFVQNLISALGIFALLIAFAIGMTAIYHDLESGSAVSIFSKPVSRFAFTVGKLAAAVVAIVVIVGLLGLEARLFILLFGGGLEQALTLEILAAVANAVTLMLLVLALSTWMNNIVAAVVAFIYNGAAGIVVALHNQMVAGFLGTNQIVHVGLTILYWIVPHSLVSDAPREIAKAEFTIFNTQNTGQNGGPNVNEALASIPGPSSVGEIIWWAFVIAVFASVVYLAVRRRQV
jgi:ABC-type transport system involved in multi-copper enzyme maturation permease subunit